MTRDEALVLLRSGQMPEHRFFQLCDESGWQVSDVVPQLLTEIGNALDDKDAEIERLRAVNEKHHNDIKMLGRTVEEQAAAIADLTAALQVVHGGLLCIAPDDEPGMREYVQGLADQARAALARAQGAMK